MVEPPPLAMPTKAVYERRRSLGVCTHCGREPEPGALKCADCVAKSRASAVRQRLRLKADGICKRCRKSPASEGASRCDDCLRKEADGAAARASARNQEGRCGACKALLESPTAKHCEACLSKKRAERRAFVQGRREAGLCIRCGQSSAGAYCTACRTDDRLQLRELKREVFAAYGGARCACCGETHVEFLQLDHINGDGKEDRKHGRKGAALYRHVRREGYPGGYQVLCANCNIAYGVFGYCPHHGQQRMRFYATDEVSRA